MQRVTIAFIFSLIFLTVVADQPIKKSSSGICHAPDSRHYDRTLVYKSYVSIGDCLESGGRFPKGYFPSEKENAGKKDYHRSKFGNGWSDIDGDCQDSRQEALIQQSTVPVRFSDERKCQVSSGRWVSTYTGEVIYNPKTIDIDHVVPLKWAWQHGADSWTTQDRALLANDPVNLLAVEASLNRQKGAKGPEKWLPPMNHCQYLSRFYRIVLKYNLLLSADEILFKEESLSRCK